MLKHEGLSGFGLKHNKRIVTKWTLGIESSKSLLDSFNKQAEESKLQELKPIKPVDIYGFQQRENYFSFDMPLLDLETGYTTQNQQLVKRLVRESFNNRTKHEAPWFNRTMTRLIASLPDSHQKRTLLSRVGPLTWCPIGYSHGDFGFANMLVGSFDLFMIDFTPSCIETPLLDIASLWISSRGAPAKEWHRELVAELMKTHGKYREQIDMIRRYLILSYFKPDQSEAKTKELLDLFYE